MAKSVSHTAAVGYALVAFSLWVLTDTGVKLVAEASLSPYEVTVFIGLIGTLFMLLKAASNRSLKDLWPARARDQIVLALSGLISNLLNVVALKHLPLTIFYIVAFMAPMIIALLAACFLKERLSLAKTAAIVAGFIGVVIAINPMQDRATGDWIGYAAAAGSVLSFSFNIVWSRTITKSETIDSLTFFNGFIQAVLCCVPAFYHFKPLTPHLLVILLVTGVLNVVANLAIFLALKSTVAANVAQIHYTQIIFGAAIGYLIWREIPTLHLVVGAVVIIASGLYIAAHAKKAENVASVSPH